MEPNSSTVCVATTNDHKSTIKLQHDDSMPLYATIMPSSSRKMRLQQQQQQQQQQIQQPEPTTKPVCSKSSNRQIVSDNRIPTTGDMIKDNESHYDSTSGESDAESLEIWSHEIPVWIKGEQRWISGVTDQTTCLDLIEALLIDEGVIQNTNDDNNNINNAGSGSSYPSKVNDYVIIERWRRVEQILEGRTKIYKIWMAWGEEQSEVKFTLKRRSDSHHSSNQYQSQSHSQTVTMGNDKDSGRGSPTGSINSAIVRRRRHRASRSTFAWMTHGQTIHPKSQKTSIERLMKLILEQGEVIQQQLAKLRDREVEISTIEEERHKMREKEHGKNYLLETYLKGLQDSEEKQELAAVNSDSGVHTEETTTTAASPEAQHDDEISDTLLPLNESNSFKVSSKKRRSKREHELLLEHETTKQYTSAITEEKKTEEAGSSSKEPLSNEVATQIDILEKLIVLNKHLQREEELMVRLGAKIKRYEADASGLSETQVSDSLNRVSEQLDNKNYELQRMESEIKTSDDTLNAKTDFLKKLYDELEEAEVEHRLLENTVVKIADATEEECIVPIPPPLPPIKSKLITQNEDLNMSREYLAENIYNISKMILKSNGQPPPSSVATQKHCAINNNPTEFIRHTPDSSLNDIQPMPLLNQHLYHLSSSFPEHQRIIQAQVHSIPTNLQSLSSPQLPPTSPQIDVHVTAPEYDNNNWDQCHSYNDAVRASMNYLATINQRIQKSNHISTNFNNTSNSIMQATHLKLGPKKLMNTQVINSNNNNIYKQSSQIAKNESLDSNSDTGLSSLGDAADVSQLGTLV